MKKTIFLITLLTLFACLFLLPAAAAVYEGDAVNRAEVNEQVAFNDIQYRLDTDTGELRIFCGAAGEQPMLSYVNIKWVPWLSEELRGEVETVVIERGVTAIGKNAFFGCENLREVYIPDSVKLIEESVFYGCNALEKIHFAGSKLTFEKEVSYLETRNYIEKDGGRLDALSFVEYGESITVELRNQDGVLFDSYTVGGYKIGDAYRVEPKEIAHMTYSGKKEAYDGRFRKGDDTTLVLTYTCAHAFAVADPTRPCGSFCTYCGGNDPDTMDAHDWHYLENQSRGLFREERVDRYCKTCGADDFQQKAPLILPILIVLGGLLVLGGIALAIILPIRRKKKMKDLTW